MPPILLSLSVAGLVLSVWAPGGLTLAVPSWLLSAPLWCALLLLLLLRCLYHPSASPALPRSSRPRRATCHRAWHRRRPRSSPIRSASRPRSTAGTRPPATTWAPSAVSFLDEVKERVRRARAAQQEWAQSSFEQRRQLLRILSRCTLDHADAICRVSARDSGKPMLDAAMGELITTLIPTLALALTLSLALALTLTLTLPLTLTRRADHHAREERVAHQRG